MVFNALVVRFGPAMFSFITHKRDAYVVFFIAKWLFLAIAEIESFYVNNPTGNVQVMCQTCYDQAAKFPDLQYEFGVCNTRFPAMKTPLPNYKPLNLTQYAIDNGRPLPTGNLTNGQDVQMMLVHFTPDVPVKNLMGGVSAKNGFQQTSSPVSWGMVIILVLMFFFPIALLLWWAKGGCTWPITDLSGDDNAGLYAPINATLLPFALYFTNKMYMMVQDDVGCWYAIIPDNLLNVNLICQLVVLIGMSSWEVLGYIVAGCGKECGVVGVLFQCIGVIAFIAVTILPVLVMTIVTIIGMFYVLGDSSNLPALGFYFLLLLSICESIGQYCFWQDLADGAGADGGDDAFAARMNEAQAAARKAKQEEREAAKLKQDKEQTKVTTDSTTNTTNSV